MRTRIILAAALAFTPVLAGCGSDADAAGNLAPDAPLPSVVPAGTKIVVGDPATRVALQLSGQLDKFTAKIEFANLSGGPQTTEAFRAKALDVGSVAEIPRSTRPGPA